MAQKEATLILRIKEAGVATLTAIPKMLQSIGNTAKSSLSGVFDKFTITAGDAYNAVKSLVTGAIDLAVNAAKYNDVKTAFEKLAASQGQNASKMLGDMQNLTAGTINNMDLMKQANQAMLLGLPIDRFDEMLKIARSSAKSTGQSMDFMLNSIVTGLGRGSKLMLDNLGILVDVDKANAEYARSLGKTAAQLTEAEKKQAFINKALQIGSENADAAGVSQLSLSDRFAQLKAKGENLAVTIGQNLGPMFQYLMEKTSQTFSAIEAWVSSSSATSFFMALTKGVAYLRTGIDMLGSSIGIGLAAAFEATKSAISLKFKEAGQMMSLGMEELKRNAIEKADELNADLLHIDELYAQKRAEATEEQGIQVNAAKQRQMEEERLAKENAYVEAELKRQEEAANEIAQLNMDEQQKLAAKISYLDKQIKAETDAKKKLALIRQKDDLLARQEALAHVEFEKKKNETIEKDRESSLRTISTLQSANNKVLATIGKAAAITQIAIETPVAIAKALAAFPPPFNFAAAGAVGAAMAVQSARIAGVQLAEGGIVRATPGGVPAIIGEGGRDEAVIPLDDDEARRRLGGGGGGVTIVVNGGLLGDQSSAREFAVAVDRELLKLRQNNESLAFDEGLV